MKARERSDWAEEIYQMFKPIGINLAAIRRKKHGHFVTEKYNFAIVAERCPKTNELKEGK